MASNESPHIPTRQKACKYTSPGKIAISIEETDVPTPGPSEVLINLTHSGVCHSDLSVMLNAWPTLPYPTQPGQIGGHEGVGRIVALGPGADVAGVKVGDRVGIKWLQQVCGSCAACLDGLDGLCSGQKVSGYYSPGTFQQYVVSPANYVTPIPEGLDDAEAAPQLCAGVTVYSALRKCNAKSGSWVLISGAGGGLGHLATQLASRGFAYRVVGVDFGEEKRELVLKSGAEAFVDVQGKSAEDVVKEVKGVTEQGLGVQAAVVCTANNAAYAQAFDSLKFGGTLVCVGIPDHSSVEIGGVTPGKMVMRGVSVVGTVTGNRRDAKEVLAFAARGVVKSHLKVVPMGELEQTFKDMEEGKIVGRVVLDLKG